MIDWSNSQIKLNEIKQDYEEKLAQYNASNRELSNQIANIEANMNTEQRVCNEKLEVTPIYLFFFFFFFEK